MLILLRSNFQQHERDAFTRLMRHAHIDTGTIFEVPLSEAPLPNGMILRLRKMKAERGAVMVMGSAEQEPLASSLHVLDAIRRGIPFLAIFPAILLAGKSEWQKYAKVAESHGTIECFEVPESRALVVERRDRYSESTYRLVLAYLLPPTLLKGDGTKRAGEQTTHQFMIGDQPSGELPRLTDEMLRSAGIEGSLNPQELDRVTSVPEKPRDSGSRDPDKS